jgi:hypothetical protein
MLALGVISACTGETEYRGIQVQRLDSDLVRFHAEIGRGGTARAAQAYARCAAVRYSMTEGYGFARHVRTNMMQEGGVWVADAVYTISETLPRGVRTLDAEVVIQDCVERGIPTI